VNPVDVVIVFLLAGPGAFAGLGHLVLILLAIAAGVGAIAAWAAAIRWVLLLLSWPFRLACRLAWRRWSSRPGERKPPAPLAEALAAHSDFSIAMSANIMLLSFALLALYLAS
jgi:hypothetical protein